MPEPIFSQTWVDAWARELGASDRYRRAAQTWEGSVLVETPATEGSPWQAVFLDLWHGECREAKTAEIADRDRADYVLSASLPIWRRVLEGELEPILAIMTGKIELARGSIAKLTPYIAASKELVAAAGRLDSVFPETTPARSEAS